ncbi:hypothetical protein PENSTE_c040G02116 [Penicillium steckii]|uniref:SAM domain-containing protein n=1 Tax=Penicillium steckii TaxID=303698 RepID=A0A1V6SIU9_9EURO|nr:hypothetical protein PENSTE_c040G02116 [Penicillium steckii]
MTNSFLDDDAYQTQMAGPWDGNSDYAPTPGIYGRTPATLYSPSPAPDCATDQPQPDHLNFLPLAEWQEGGEYDEMPPRYICYTIAWKLILNRKTVGKVTEEDLVIAPSEYWGKSLQANVENMLQTKKKRYQRVRSEGTAVTVKVDERSQKKLEKFCNSTNIDWAPVEKQLRKWSNLLRIGRKVTIELAFTYREDDDAHSMPSSRRVEKRGRVSATSRMLAEREAHIVAEEEATGQPSTWEYVYRLMGCDVRSCPHKSDWCWEDPKDKKHYKLRGPHLERLIDYVDEGGILDGHDDVPSDVRRDLVLESQTGRKSKKADTSTPEPPYHPTIINVLSGKDGSASTVTSAPPRTLAEEPLIIAGPRELAVKKYCKWLESRATEETYKADFRKICQVTLDNRLDLELILEDSDTGFFVQQGVPIGTARRFLRDINEWATAVNSNSSLDQAAE